MGTDLLTYKNILSKMAKGKELMEEVLQRERKRPPSGWRRRPRPRPRPPGTPPRRTGAPEPLSAASPRKHSAHPRTPCRTENGGTRRSSPNCGANFPRLVLHIRYSFNTVDNIRSAWHMPGPLT